MAVVHEGCVIDVECFVPVGVTVSYVRMYFDNVYMDRNSTIT